MKTASLLARTVANLAAARAIAKEVVDGEIVATRIFLQVGEDGPTYELGRTTARRHQTEQEIRASIHDLLIRLAERWET